MATTFRENTSTALLSDAIAHSIDGLATTHDTTLPMLYDLLEFAQSAVLAEDILVTPLVYDQAAWLRDIDCVQPLEIDVTQSAAPAGETDTDSITIDADADGNLFSDHPLGDLALALTMSVGIRQEPVLGNLVAPGQVVSASDRFAQLPVVMIMLQHWKGILPFASEEARQSLNDAISPALDSYARLSHLWNRLNQQWDIDVVTSVLAQPLFSNLVVDQSTSFAGQSDITQALKTRFENAALGAHGRQAFFEEWRIPPVGLIVLKDLASIDEFPQAIARARERFGGLRDSICALRQERRQLVEDVSFDSAAGEKAMRDLAALDSEIQRVFAEFDARIEYKRQRFERTETVFSVLNFVLRYAKGPNLSLIGYLVDKFDLKRRAVLQKIPGLFRASSEIVAADGLSAFEWVEKMIPSDQMRKGQRTLLNLSFGHAQDYSNCDPGQEPEEFVTWQVEDYELTDRDFWITTARNNEMTEGFTKGTLFGE